MSYILILIPICVVLILYMIQTKKNKQTDLAKFSLVKYTPKNMGDTSSQHDTDNHENHDPKIPTTGSIRLEDIDITEIKAVSLIIEIPEGEGICLEGVDITEVKAVSLAVETPEGESIILENVDISEIKAVSLAVETPKGESIILENVDISEIKAEPLLDDALNDEELEEHKTPSAKTISDDKLASNKTKKRKFTHLQNFSIKRSVERRNSKNSIAALTLLDDTDNKITTSEITASEISTSEITASEIPTSKISVDSALQHDTKNTQNISINQKTDKQNVSHISTDNKQVTENLNIPLTDQVDRRAENQRAPENPSNDRLSNNISNSLQEGQVDRRVSDKRLSDISTDAKQGAETTNILQTDQIGRRTKERRTGDWRTEERRTGDRRVEERRTGDRRNAENLDSHADLYEKRDRRVTDDRRVDDRRVADRRVANTLGPSEIDRRVTDRRVTDRRVAGMLANTPIQLDGVNIENIVIDRQNPSKKRMKSLIGDKRGANNLAHKRPLKNVIQLGTMDAKSIISKHTHKKQRAMPIILENQISNPKAFLVPEGKTDYTNMEIFFHSYTKDSNGDKSNDDKSNDDN